MKENLNNINKESCKTTERPFGIPPKACLLHKNDWGDEVWMFKENNRSVGLFGFQLVKEDGMVSEPIFKKRAQLLSKTGFNFMYDLAADFGHDDMVTAKNEFLKIQHKMIELEVCDKCSIEHLYKTLCNYAEEHSGEGDEVTITEVDGQKYANIVAKAVFEQAVKDCDIGWSALEVKKLFKRLDLLRVNKDRQYDYAVSNGDKTSYRVISFRLDAMGGTEDGAEAV